MLLQLRCSLQVLVFGNVILKGANILAEGSELLLEIVDPGIIGGASNVQTGLQLLPFRIDPLCAKAKCPYSCNP